MKSPCSKSRSWYKERCRSVIGKRDIPAIAERVKCRKRQLGQSEGSSVERSRARRLLRSHEGFVDLRVLIKSEPGQVEIGELAKKLGDIEWTESFRLWFCTWTNRTQESKNHFHFCHSYIRTASKYFYYRHSVISNKKKNKKELKFLLGIKRFNQRTEENLRDIDFKSSIDHSIASIRIKR